MNILQLFFDHFWLVVLFLIFFGGSIGAALKWSINRILKHREKMQELINEELRLQIKVAGMNKENVNKKILRPTPSPKEASKEELGQTMYQTGYPHQDF